MEFDFLRLGAQLVSFGLVIAITLVFILSALLYKKLSSIEGRLNELDKKVNNFTTVEDK